MRDRRGQQAGALGRSGSSRQAVVTIAVGAVLLRLLLLLGRGDYLAFDEGWYLLLARSIYTGEGYSLVGMPHVTLSPLFPILAGALGWLIDSWLWGGRIVAAVASGLVVLPAWSIFRRLATGGSALVAAALVAVLPSMAPFVVPFWIGADLWVGAEPLLHLFLYTGVAFWLRAQAGGRLWSWGAAGAAFALAFVARPEAIITWGLLGLVSLAIAMSRRSPRTVAGAALMGATLVVVAAPYWVYNHTITGEWTLTGRAVAPVATATRAVGPLERGGPASGIEGMLWADDDAYERYLYGLDHTRLRLQSDYWGFPGDSAMPQPVESGEAVPPPPGSSPDRATDRPSTFALYVRALGIILPLLLWPFVILGLAQPRPRSVLRRELPVTLSLVGTSLAIAFLVAVDPRTQLFLVPLLSLYAARGFSVVEQEVQKRTHGRGLRPGFVETGLAVIAVVWLLGINAQRLYRSVVLGSPHHIVAEQNRLVAEGLDRVLEGEEGPVASWHPAIAVFADRDWRVLPYADLPAVARYTTAAGAKAVVLSAYYPPDVGVENLDTRYLVLKLPASATAEAVVERAPERWNLQIEERDSIIATGSLTPVYLPGEPEADR